MLGVGEYFSDYHVEVRGESIRSWGILKRERSPRIGKGWPFRLHMEFPNLVMIQPSPRYKSLVVHTPIDEEQTWIAVRTVQTYVTVPLLRHLLDMYCSNFLFWVPIHRQDFPVFHYQRPRRTGVGVNKLLRPDEAIAKYLSIRHKLLKQQGSSEQLDSGLHPLPCTPYQLPNARLGIESSVGRLTKWFGLAVLFPLLMFSYPIAHLMNWWDERKESKDPAWRPVRSDQ